MTLCVPPWVAGEGGDGDGLTVENREIVAISTIYTKQGWQEKNPATNKKDLEYESWVYIDKIARRKKSLGV